MKKLLLILICVLCMGLVGCGSGGNKVYDIEVSESTKDRNMKTATMTLVDIIDESPIDDEQYMDTFLNDVWEDLQIEHETGAVVSIKDKDGNDCGSAQFTKDGNEINYIFIPKGGSMKTGTIN